MLRSWSLRRSVRAVDHLRASYSPFTPIYRTQRRGFAIMSQSTTTDNELTRHGIDSKLYKPIVWIDCEVSILCVFSLWSCVF